MAQDQARPQGEARPVEKVIKAAMGRLERAQSRHQGTIVLRLLGEGGGKFHLHSDPGGCRLSRQPGPAQPHLEVIGDTARFRAVLDGSRVDKHVRTAAACCPALAGRSVTPHQLRHSGAVVMLQATRDIRKVALWLGHADLRTTEACLRVDPTEKLEAVQAVPMPGLRRGRFKAPDALIAALLGPAAPALTRRPSIAAASHASPAP